MIILIILLEVELIQNNNLRNFQNSKIGIIVLIQIKININGINDNIFKYEISIF